MRHSIAKVAWAAGFFEGEGCIYFQNGRAKLQLSQVDLGRLEWVQAVLGGYIAGPYLPPSRPHNRPYFVWHLNDMVAVSEAISLIWPHVGRSSRKRLKPAYRSCMIRMRERSRESRRYTGNHARRTKMEKVSNRKKAILEILDEQIAELEAKLAKAQPLFDELNQLKKTRATLLSERTTTGGVRAGTQVTMEQVVHAMRENGDEMTAGQIAEAIGADQTVVRSHLNRHKDTRYRKVNGNEWALIGEDDEDDDE